MSVREGAWLSKNDKDFILRALRSGRRVDGRRLGDMRLLRMVFSRAEGKASAEVQLGRTRVLAVLTSEIIPPLPDRPTEGFLSFNVELGPMAVPSEGERNSPLSIEIARVIEVGVRDSQALDTEALCIIGGEKVWQLRCDVHILDHGGNLIDACTLATMAALRHFRRPEVTIAGSTVTVHHTDDKEPQPLALHHVPICVTFAIFEIAIMLRGLINHIVDDARNSLEGWEAKDNDTVLGGSDNRSARGVSGSSGFGKFTKRQHTAVDPTEVEEEVMKGRITFALTPHKELCALHKNGGVAMSAETILGCARLAAVKVTEIHRVLDSALASADEKAAKERQARLRGTAPDAAGARQTSGTKSTPFVVAHAPLPVAPESLKVKHLEYDDLHVTQSICEEGMRGGSSRKDRGLDIRDAMETDLFAKMAKAAKMTATSLAQEDEEERHGSRKCSTVPQVASGGLTGAAATTEAHDVARHRAGRDSGRNGCQREDASVGVSRGSMRPETSKESAAGGDIEEQRRSTSALMSPTVKPRVSRRPGKKAEGNGDGGGREQEQLSSTADREFEVLAKKLQSAERVSKPEGHAGTGRLASGGRGGPESSNSPMEVDSDDETTVVLRGEFLGPATSVGLTEASSGERVPVGSGKVANQESKRVHANVVLRDDGDDDDLTSAVKAGKGKGKGKGKGWAKEKGGKAKDKGKQKV